MVKLICDTSTFCGSGFSAYFADDHSLLNIFFAIPKPLPDDGFSTVSFQNQFIRLQLLKLDIYSSFAFFQALSFFFPDRKTYISPVECVYEFFLFEILEVCM